MASAAGRSDAPSDTSCAVGGAPRSVHASRCAVRHASKSFGETIALRDVDLSIAPGEVHALLGANGSGKSTLVRLLSGVYRPEPATEILIDGESVGHGWSTGRAWKHNVRVVHQESLLIDQLTIADHFGLRYGFPRNPAHMIRRNVLAQLAQQALDELNLGIDARSVAKDLSADERAKVAIALATFGSNHNGLLILDEATALLQTSEAEDLLSFVTDLASAGESVLMVTHRLDEVAEHCHKATVLFNGQVSLETDQVADRDSLINAMVGHAERRRAARRRRVVFDETRAAQSPVLTIDYESQAVDRATQLSVMRGEILGIAGSEAVRIARTLAGVTPCIAELVTIGSGHPEGTWNVTRAVQAGVGYLPQDRHLEGGLLSFSVRDNISLPCLGKYWWRRDLEREDAMRMVDLVDVRPRDIERSFGDLSGGNQQKVLLARWLLFHPLVLVLEDPMYGVDPDARRILAESILGEADRGTAVVVTSTEPAQLVAMCDRVITVQDGVITSELRDSEVTEGNILHGAFG